MQIINQAIVDDAFLYLSAQLPEVLCDKDRSYLQALKDFRRHLLNTLQKSDISIN